MTNMIDWKDKNVIVTGGNGFLGSHLCDLLREKGCEPFVPFRQDPHYDLRQADNVFHMLNGAGPGGGRPIDYLFNLAANVGGIGYNQKYPYTLFFDNAQLGINLIDQSIKSGVRKFIQIGTVCSYPKWVTPPFKEMDFWDGYPEETNAPYGLAKKMLLVQLQAARLEFNFNGIYLVPTNLYGPRDQFDPERSHVIPALIRKCIEAKREKHHALEVWGSGQASRDFLYVKDAVRAILLAAEKYDRPEPLNLGSGREVQISTLLPIIKTLVDFEGSIRWDSTRPDGQPRRVLDISSAKKLGWEPQTLLWDGLKETIDWYRAAGPDETPSPPRLVLKGIGKLLPTSEYLTSYHRTPPDEINEQKLTR